MLFEQIFTQLFINVIAWIPGIVALWLISDLFVNMIFKDK